jgi:hypothetical protein
MDGFWHCFTDIIYVLPVSTDLDVELRLNNPLAFVHHVNDTSACGRESARLMEKL